MKLRIEIDMDKIEPMNGVEVALVLLSLAHKLEHERMEAVGPFYPIMDSTGKKRIGTAAII